MPKAENLHVEQVAIDSLLPFEGNPRSISDSGLAKITRSIETFGFTNPVLAQKGTRMIIAGHQRIKAAKEAGIETVPVIWLDFDDATSRAYNLADNRTADEATWDEELLAVVVRELEEADMDLLVTGLDDAEIERILGREPEPEPPEPVEIRTDLPVEVINCDARDVAKHVKPKSVQTVITSPPYWGLRDYGIEPSVWGGMKTCGHEWGDVLVSPAAGYNNVNIKVKEAIREGDGGAFCTTCGAWKGALGLEPTPELFVEHIVEIYREIKKVLRDDGTIWVNLGDSYNGSGGAGGDYAQGGLKEGQPTYPGRSAEGLKPKDLCGIPWRVAFALQADGWYLRSDIIWNKSNPMPESVTDRPTKAHEYIFLLAKSERYFYDADAVREEPKPEFAGHDVVVHQGKTGEERRENAGSFHIDGLKGANRKTVWTISTHSYPEAHFATFPPALVEPMVKAGSSPLACETCGAPWEHKVEADRDSLGSGDWKRPETETGDAKVHHISSKHHWDQKKYSRTDHGYQPGCDCEKNEGKGVSVVLDPFAGSGTTLQVASELGRAAVGLEVNPTYIDLIHKRLSKVEVPSE